MPSWFYKLFTKDEKGFSRARFAQVSKLNPQLFFQSEPNLSGSPTKLFHDGIAVSPNFDILRIHHKSPRGLESHPRSFNEGLEEAIH